MKKGRGNYRLDNYVYLYLDNRKLGKWEFRDWTFLYQPFYVGRGLDDRINAHTKPSELSKPFRKSRIINKIRRVLGEEVIRFKLYEDLSYQESAFLEKDIIAFFGREKNGGILVNLSKDEWDRPAKERTSKTSNSRALPTSKRVNQYSLDGVFIKTWEYLTEIRNSLRGKSRGIEYRIRECCRGERDNCDGFIWKYEGTSPYSPPRIPQPHSKPVFQYFNGNFVKSYESGVEAALQTGLNHKAISLCCLGKTKTSGGFRWFFEYVGESIPPLAATVRKLYGILCTVSDTKLK